MRHRIFINKAVVSKPAERFESSKRKHHGNPEEKRQAVKGRYDDKKNL